MIEIRVNPEDDALATLAKDWVVWRLGSTATTDEIHRMALAVWTWFRRDPSKAALARAQLCL